jgi:hypothetical protein
MSSIVQDVEMAAALLDSYRKALGQVDMASAFGTIGHRLEGEAVVGSAEQMYTELWSRLDSARTAAAGSGRDVSRYDQLRPYAGVLGVTSEVKLKNAVVATGNDQGARAAAEAITLFRAVFADLPWHAVNEPVPDVRNGRTIALLITIAAVVALIALYSMS